MPRAHQAASQGIPFPTTQRPPAPCDARGPARASVHWRSNEASLNRDSLNAFLGGQQKLDITEAMMKAATIGRVAEMGDGWEPPGMITRKIANVLAGPNATRPGAQRVPNVTTLVPTATKAAIKSTPVRSQSESSILAAPQRTTQVPTQIQWVTMLGPRQLPSQEPSFPRRVKDWQTDVESPMARAARSITGPRLVAPGNEPEAQRSWKRGDSALGALLDPGVVCHTFSREAR
mmetsp:Transcript_81471/g.143881  ORF Transcript_81471/g.143881 Transcript_81471/m.143881 type:complete len:233 (-) Transcript_81471:93-791(-)